MKKVLIFLILSSCMNNIERKNRINKIIKLFETGNDVNSKDTYGCMLMYFCWEHAYGKENRKEIVETLIKRGANVNFKDNQGRTALFCVCENGYKKIAKTLIDAGSEINYEDNSGCTPLELAFIHKKLEISKLLIRKGANVNYINKNGNSILSRAAIYSCKELIKLLIKKGACFCSSDSVSCKSSLIIKAGEKEQKAILRSFITNEKFSTESLILIFEQILKSTELKEDLKLKDLILKNISEEISIGLLFSLDEFTIIEQSLFIRVFSSLVETLKLKYVEKIKEMKKNIIELFLEYYRGKLNKAQNYEKDFINKKELIEIQMKNYSVTEEFTNRNL